MDGHIGETTSTGPSAESIHSLCENLSTLYNDCDVKTGIMFLLAEEGKVLTELTEEVILEAMPLLRLSKCRIKRVTGHCYLRGLLL